MRWLWCLILFMMVGCQSQTLVVRMDQSYSTPFAIGKIINDADTGRRSDGSFKGALPMQGYYSSIRVGPRISLTDNIKLELTIGPSAFFREAGVGQYFAMQATPRLIYDQYWIKPYLEGVVGVGYLPQKWDGEATNYQFSSGSTLGISIPLDSDWELDIGYRLYHISNGSAIFGSPRPNVGYNTDGIIFGITRKF